MADAIHRPHQAGLQFTASLMRTSGSWLADGDGRLMARHVADQQRILPALALAQDHSAILCPYDILQLALNVLGDLGLDGVDT